VNCERLEGFFIFTAPEPNESVCRMPIELINLFQIQSPEGVAGEAVKLWQCKEDTLAGD